MSWKEIETHWPDLKEAVRHRWERLSDLEIETVRGQRERLAGRIQSAYGIPRERAIHQIEDWSRKLH